MSREKALSAALQLQHDAGLERPGPAAVSDSAKPDIVRRVAGSPQSAAISGKYNATSDAYRVRRTAQYMMAMGLWRPPVDTEMRGPLTSATCNACTSCRDCFPEVPI